MCDGAVSYSHLPRQLEIMINGTGTIVFFEQPQAPSEAECSTRPATASEPRVKIFDEE